MRVKLPRSRGSQFYLVQLVGVAVGLLLTGLGAWRVGVSVVGVTFLAGAVARAVVSHEHVGMLRVRGKAFDIVWMTTLGVALLGLALVIPAQPGR